MPRTMTLMNDTGDVTIGWDENDADRMLPIIQAKLDAGFTFFILASGAKDSEQEVRLKTIDQIGSARRVILSDREFEAAFGEGVIGVVESDKPPKTHHETKRRANSAQEVVDNNTVATAPAKGG